MAQLNLYVPDELAERLRREAKTAGLSLSRYVLSLLQLDRADSHRHFLDSLCGFLTEDMEEPQDAPPEPVDVS
jgi:hypothetical protein